MTSTSTNWTINVSDIRTVKVSNVALSASEQDVKEFLSFSGDVLHVEIRREDEGSQVAFVTFKDPHGADTATLLSGAAISDRSVTITPVENYKPPYTADHHPGWSGAVRKAEEAVSTVLAKGFVVGKEAVKRAKALEEGHGWASNASAAAVSLERRMGLLDKLSSGGAAVRGVDGRFQVSERARAAMAAAERAAAGTGAALMSSPYVSSGVSWVSGALGAVTRAAGDVAAMTKEKVGRAEEEETETAHRRRTEFVDNYARLHLDDDVFEDDDVVPFTGSPSGEAKLHVI